MIDGLAEWLAVREASGSGRPQRRATARAKGPVNTMLAAVCTAQVARERRT
jgi:hypothetical protein